MAAAPLTPGRVAAAPGYLALPGRRLLEVTGRDRTDYLHRMLTQDVEGLAPGHAAAACYLTPTGRILAHLLLWNLGERLLLDVAPGAAPEAMALLERYVIADDVTFHDVSERHARALLVGPGVGAALAAAGAQAAPATGQILTATLGGASAWLWGAMLGGRPAVHVLAAAGDAPRVLEALARGATRWEPADLERVRVEEGVPAAGTELDERILPNEARLDDAVSFTKGCYPGQEPVIMARHRGHPSTLLVRLALEAEALPAPGTALLDGERAVGRLTTVVTGSDGRPAALGFVRHALARAGQRLGVAGGGSATVL